MDSMERKANQISEADKELVVSIIEDFKKLVNWNIQ
jgi:hypothetical protein